MHARLEQGLACLLGFLAAAALFAAALAAGRCSLRETLHRALQAESRAGRDTLLCAGDGLTRGLSAAFPYPGLLDSLLWLTPPRWRARVVNAGLPGANTAQVLRAMREMLPRLRPHVVLILAGAENEWNWAGYQGPMRLRAPAGVAIEQSLPASFCRWLRHLQQAGRGDPGPGPRAAPPEPAPEPARALALGEEALRQNRLPRAQVCFEQAHAFDPESAAPVLGLGCVAQARGDLDRALAWYTKGFQVHRPSARAYALTGLCYQAREEDRLAVWTLARGVVVFPRSAAAAMGLARYFFNRCEYPQACIWGVRAIGCAEGDETDDAFRFLGTCLRLMRRENDARLWLEAGRRSAGGECPGCLEELALVAAQQGKLDEAIRLTALLLRLCPGRADLCARAGHLCRLAGRTQDALQYFDRGIRIDPENPKNFKGRGLVLRQTHDPVRAAAALEEALRLNPADESAQAALLACLRATGAPTLVRQPRAPDDPQSRLDEWTRCDLAELVALCRACGATPVLLTYPYGTRANPVIRRVAGETRSPLIELYGLPDRLPAARALRAVCTPRRCNGAGFLEIARAVRAELAGQNLTGRESVAAQD